MEKISLGASSKYTSIRAGNARQYSVEELISALNDDASREQALLLLSKMRTRHEDMGQLLWDSNGTIFSLLKEIMQVYSLLSTQTLSEERANRICNVLALLQTVATHPNTRMKFIKANIHEYLYPFISTTSQEKSFGYLRLTSLGVIGALLKENEAQVAKPLLEGDIVPKLLICLDVGNLLSKTVAALILDKLLNNGESGLDYCCASAERFYSVSRALGRAVEELSVEPCQRLLKYVICCYIKLSQNPRACDALRLCLPVRFRDSTFHGILKDDPVAMASLKSLVDKVVVGHRHKNAPLAGAGGLSVGRSNSGKAVIGAGGGSAMKR